MATVAAEEVPVEQEQGSKEDVVSLAADEDSKYDVALVGIEKVDTDSKERTEELGKEEVALEVVEETEAVAVVDSTCNTSKHKADCLNAALVTMDASARDDAVSKPVTQGVPVVKEGPSASATEDSSEDETRTNKWEAEFAPLEQAASPSKKPKKRLSLKLPSVKNLFKKQSGKRRRSINDMSKDASVKEVDRGW